MLWRTAGFLWNFAVFHLSNSSFFYILFCRLGNEESSNDDVNDDVTSHEVEAAAVVLI